MNYGIILFVLMLSTSTLTLKPNINAIVDEIPVGAEGKNYTINSTTEYIISVSGLSSDLSKIPPRIYVECFHCDKTTPAIIIFKQKNGVTSFELPFVLKKSDQEEVAYNKTERTLCPYDKTNQWHECDNNLSCMGNDEENGTLIVSLSTSSEINIIVSLKVVLVDDFVLQLDTNKTITLTPESPKFYLYEFSNDLKVGSVILEMKSQFNNCMVLSIQNKSCPLVDTGFVYHTGYFQTVTCLGGMTIKRDMFPLGFYTVFSLKADDSYCLSSNGLKDSLRLKTVEFSLHKSIPTEEYLYVVVGTLCVILLVYVVMITITFLCFMRKDIQVPELENCISSHEASTSALHRQTFNDSDNPGTLKVTSPTTDDTLSIRTDSSLDETDLDVVTDVELDKNIFRTKVTLYLSDLAKKNPTVLKKKSELYFWNLMTVAIFYGLPASQLVFTDEYNFRLSGNGDLCYYNFLCSHPFGKIFDFNHFFSNVGYVALGLLFLIITWRKEKVHTALLCQNKILDWTHGVPQHFGLYYAMGTSLIIEGFLSACYHICPNIYNFQFDASFMYVISILCMVKIYQSRHPDVNATAYSTFFLIAFVLFLGICGIFTSFSHFFWAILTTIHIGTVLYISLHIYYVGRFGFDFRAVDRNVKEFQFGVLRTVQFWRPMYPKRFCLIAVINLCNCAFPVVALLNSVKDVYSYLLMIFIANLMLYTTFYIIMKVLSGEKILLQPCIYTLLAVLCWSAALYYFYNKTISWKKTPAESRMYNKPCVLFDFYDNHDIWHFFSSGGLFFSFLVLLTLDDDLIFVHRSKILVF